MDLHISLVGRKNLSGEIYRQIRHAITDGRLRPGDCLPATRHLARSLQVSRTTVAVAYDRLSAEGFLTSRTGAGTFVSDHLPATRQKTMSERSEGALRARPFWDSVQLSRAFAKPAEFDFRSGLPDATLFPHEEWRRLLARELRSHAATAGVYDESGGNRHLREAIARHVGVSRGLQVSAGDVTITNGAQQAIDLVARTLVAPGDCVAVEDPGYAPPRYLFSSLGARVQGVPVDDEGIVVDAIAPETRLVYVSPSHQYPLGVTMSLARRLALLDWATRHNAAIIEDDYDSEFRFEVRPLEPLRTLDTSGRVVYVGSFSKTLLPTLRLGFLVTPSCCTTAVHKAKYVSDWHTSTLVQLVLARFIDDGGFARHLRKLGRVYAERRALITNILKRDFADHLTVVPSIAGLHITAVARTASIDDIKRVFDCAGERGVQTQRLERFYFEQPALAGLLFGYGAIPTAKIPEGLCKLRRCFD
jgi:GntR family transcriptional regulator/MocR family aminotransferase